jgi:hypothetical protein
MGATENTGDKVSVRGKRDGFGPCSNPECRKLVILESGLCHDCLQQKQMAKHTRTCPQCNQRKNMEQSYKNPDGSATTICSTCNAANKRAAKRGSDSRVLTPTQEADVALTAASVAGSAAEPVAKSGCRHHWICEPAQRAKEIKAVCRICGEERGFPNTVLSLSVLYKKKKPTEVERLCAEFFIPDVSIPNKVVF